MVDIVAKKRNSGSLHSWCGYATKVKGNSTGKGKGKRQGPKHTW